MAWRLDWGYALALPHPSSGRATDEQHTTVEQMPTRPSEQVSLLDYSAWAAYGCAALVESLACSRNWGGC